jgi:hypothetical protein
LTCTCTVLSPNIRGVIKGWIVQHQVLEFRIHGIHEEYIVLVPNRNMPLFIQNQSLLSLVLLLLDTMTQAAPAPGSPRRRCPSQPQPTAPGHEKGTLRHSVMSSRPQHRHVLIIRGLKVRQMAHGSPHEPATPRTPAAQPSNSFNMSTQTYVVRKVRPTHSACLPGSRLETFVG